MVQLTASNETTIEIINEATVLIDDVLREKITQYDILRTLPVGSDVVALSVPGQLLAQVLTTRSISLKETRMFLAYTRVETTLYVRDHTQLINSNVTTLHYTNVTQTKSLMEYLKIKYPPC
jgi:hypothetical protein